MDLAARLSALDGDGLTDRGLRAAQLDLIRPRVGFDAHLFAMTDPSTGVITSPHATLPMVDLAELPGVIRRRYATGGEAQWRSVVAGFGVSDVVSVRLEDRWGRWGLLELWRSSTTFTDAERALLGALVPTLTKSLRRAVARTFAVPDGEVAAPLESGVVLVDDELHVQSSTSGAARALMRLLPPTEPGPPVPAAAYNVVAALLAHEDGVWSGEPWGRVHLGANRWASIRAERLGDGIAVSIGPSTAAEREDLFSRAHNLSPRLTQVLRLALRGMDTRAIADELVIARTTAEDHLKALLARTGSASRHQLLARALGA